MFLISCNSLSCLPQTNNQAGSLLGHRCAAQGQAFPFYITSCPRSVRIRKHALLLPVFLKSYNALNYTISLKLFSITAGNLKEETLAPSWDSHNFVSSNGNKWVSWTAKLFLELTPLLCKVIAGSKVLCPIPVTTKVGGFLRWTDG